jgi:hypothetical protein
VIAHWDGRKLSVVRGFPSAGRLSALAAVSANDIWAVGGTVHGRPVALHWDGTRWHNVATPALPASGRFAGVAALSPSDVWAVGQVGTQVLVEHWDGRAWRLVPIKQEGAFAAVDGHSPNDVWAVGAQGLTGPSVNDTGSLAMHWDGRRWRYVDDPGSGGDDEGLNQFEAVDVVSGSELWAMRANGLASHDRHGWRDIGVRNQVGGLLYGITAVRPNDVWAVGYGDGGPVVVHSDGRTASVRYTPFEHAAGTLSSVSMLAPKDIWAAGNRQLTRYSCT